MMALAEHKAQLIRELRLARAIIAPSRAHARSVAGFLGIDADELALRVLGHGRDLREEERVPLASPAESGRLLLGSWGHLQPLKGQELILEALRLVGEPDAIELHLAGAEVEPGYSERLRELAQGLRVHLHGPFAEGELAAHPVAAVHALVSGTRGLESWGLIVDEAAALRLPMVLPRSGAFPERLREGEGVLFYEQGDARSLADCLRRLLREPDCWPALGERLPPLARLVPTLDEHVERVLEVYREALEKGVPTLPEPEWWRDKLRSASEEQWDAELSRRSAAELGFEEPAT
jgi:glycosyltransferase involved in cell wall biosynthesis